MYEKFIEYFSWRFFRKERMDLERNEGGPSRREIINGIRRELQAGGTLFKHEIDDMVDSLENAGRAQLESMKAHYQTSTEKTVENLSSEPKGPATREMERSGSRRLDHFERMENLLDQLIVLTPEE